SMLKNLTTLFGSGSGVEEAWVDSDESLTPREKLVRQISAIMQWGSIVNMLLLLVLNFILAFGYAEASEMGTWIFSGWDGTTGEMNLLGLAAIGANVA